VGRNENDGRVVQELEIVAQALFVDISVAGAFAFAHAHGLRRTARFQLAAGDEIPFVHDDDHRASTLVGVACNGSVELADAFGGVDHEQRDVGAFEMLASHHDGKFLRH